MSIIATTENTILDQIKSVLMIPGSAKIREAATLPGSWSYALLKLVLQKAPGIYVSFIGGRNSKQANTAMIDGRFAVYAVSKEADEETRRRGNARVIGAYDMIEICAAQLHNLVVPNIGTLKLQDIDNLFGEAMYDLGGTVYAASFNLEKMEFELPLNEADLNAFVTFHAEHSIAPGTDEPAAIDNVTLEQ